MINHPLFNEDDTNEERASRDIGYINIRQFEGSRSVMLVGQWEPAELQSTEDVYNAVGAGHFELIGRHARTKRIIDRVLMTIKVPRAAGSAPEPEPRGQPRQPPEPPAPVIQQPPMMQAGSIVIPPGMDPQTVMMVLSSQQNAALLQAQREESRFNASQLTQIMVGFTNAQTQMVTGLVSGLAGMMGHTQPQGGANGTVDGFLKGIEIMADLKAGMKEGAENEGKPTQWNEVTRNIADGIRNIVEVAKVAQATAPSGPVVPPGTPP
jgi:hypothetical protein